MKKATYSLLALLLLGLLLGVGYWAKGYLGFGRTNADLLEASPSEIALAFAQNLDQGPSWGFEDAPRSTFYLGDIAQSLELAFLEAVVSDRYRPQNLYQAALWPLW